MITYEITTSSSILLNDIPLYDETVTQQWKLTIEDVLGAGFLLIIDMVEKPWTNSAEMQPLYMLLDIVNDAIKKIVVRIDRFGRIIGVANQKAINKAWEECKKRTLISFGEEKFVVRILNDADFNFANVSRAFLQRSVPYFILISSFADDRSFTFRPPSFINNEEEISVKMNQWDKKYGEKGHVRIMEGEGSLGFFSKVGRKYDNEIKPYAKDDFDFHYRMDTEYLYTSGGLFFDRATATVTEQASRGYLYRSKTEMIQLK